MVKEVPWRDVLFRKVNGIGGITCADARFLRQPGGQPGGAKSKASGQHVLTEIYDHVALYSDDDPLNPRIGGLFWQ